MFVSLSPFYDISRNYSQVSLFFFLFYSTFPCQASSYFPQPVSLNLDLFHYWLHIPILVSLSLYYGAYPYLPSHFYALTHLWKYYRVLNQSKTTFFFLIFFILNTLQFHHSSSSTQLTAKNQYNIDRFLPHKVPSSYIVFLRQHHPSTHSHTHFPPILLSRNLNTLLNYPPLFINNYLLQHTHNI